MGFCLKCSAGYRWARLRNWWVEEDIAEDLKGDNFFHFCLTLNSLGMPNLSGARELVPFASPSSSAKEDGMVVHTVHHSISGNPRVLVSWGQGNTLRLSYLPEVNSNGDEDQDMAMTNPSFRDDEAGSGKVVEVKLEKKDDRPLAEKRALAYSSVQAFAFLQSKKQQMLHHDGGPSRTVYSDWYVIFSF